MNVGDFWKYVDKTDTCWLWTRSRTKAGYGNFRDSAAGINRYAHVFAYEEVVGPIGAGMELDHSCFVPNCVRPEHLSPVTHKRNGENRRSAPSNSTTGIRGVSFHKRAGKWRAYAVHHDKQYHLGLFARIEDAEAAAIEGRTRLYGVLTRKDLA